MSVQIPYVNAYGNLKKLFSEIAKASVPPKFTVDFMSTSLGLKSSSYRAMIPLLKHLGFLDEANTPTQVYKNYKDEKNAKKIMARQIKQAYSDLFKANEYAHKLDKSDLLSKLRVITGASESDKRIPAMASTFMELVTLANFEGKVDLSKRELEKTEEIVKPLKEAKELGKIGLSYTINLNLPATTEIEVFNAIFKSLKEHILNEK